MRQVFEVQDLLPVVGQTLQEPRLATASWPREKKKFTRELSGSSFQTCLHTRTVMFVAALQHACAKAYLGKNERHTS